MLKKKMTKVLTGVLALSMLSGCGSASKMAMESAYDTAASNYSAAGGVYYDSGDYEYAEEVSVFFRYFLGILIVAAVIIYTARSTVV